MSDEKKTVYQLISAVAGELAREGIEKNRTGMGFKFRGIDDVYNAISPLLASHGLSVLPRALSRDCVERVSGQGKALFYVTVDMEFDFVSAHDGSKHTVKMFGEAMDSGDKATNKAMSAAYKYAMFQAFCIPTEGDNDADSTSHQIEANAASRSPAPAKPPVTAMNPALKADCLAAIEAAADIDGLKAAYAGAYKAARDTNDTGALSQFDKAKEARKAALTEAV